MAIPAAVIDRINVLRAVEILPIDAYYAECSECDWTSNSSVQLRDVIAAAEAHEKECPALSQE